MGRSDLIRFWEDVRIGIQPFKSLFPRMYQLSTKHDAPISDFYSCLEGENQMAWSFLFRHHPLERDLQYVVDL